MTKIHFIRHGDVENPDNVYYGRLPGFPLSQEGRSCIEFSGRQLSRLPITHIYHSPMLRTMQSAEILASVLHCPTTADERLIEIATLFEGKPRGDATRVSSYPPIKSGYAETMAEIYNRMADFVRETAGRHPEQEIIAVSHGGPIRLLELGITGRPFTEAIYEEQEVPLCGADTSVTVDVDKLGIERIDI